MIDFIKGWIINIVTLSMLIVLLEILLPSGRLKKFVNLASGLVLIIAIINPVLVQMKKGADLKAFQISGSNFMDRREIENNSKILEKEQMRQIVEVYRKKLIRQIEDVAKAESGSAEARADVIINEDYESQNFGEIKRIYVYLKEDAENSGFKPVTKVGKIKISRGDTDVEEPAPQVSQDVKEKLEKKIGGIFGVQDEDIVIAILEE